ncbi:MAG: hypothetical protein ACRCT1_21145 [Microcoleaceae cyanobacterium]|jgi:hypothetical protein
MLLIKDIVQHALKTGNLTQEAETELQNYLTQKYTLEELNAVMMLRFATTTGYVKETSHSFCADS